MSRRKTQQHSKNLELFPLPPELDAPPPRPPGARRERLPPSPAGGGYLDCCTGAEPPVEASARGAGTQGGDPRLAELRRMGLGVVWRSVAERIGFDAFIAAWEVLAASDQVMDDRYRVCVPRFGTFLRYQRNQLIRSLAECGASPAEIEKELKRLTGDAIRRDHIVRILKTGTMTA